MAAGLMSNYYGGPNPLAAGVSGFADSFLGAYKTIGGMGQKDREIAIQEAYRKAQEAEMAQNALVRQAQIANINSEVQKRDFERAREADMLTAMQNIPQSKYLSGLMQMGDPTAGISQEENAARAASPQFAPTIADRLGVLANYSPEKALAIEASMVRDAQKGLTLADLVKSGKWTPESVKKVQATGDISQLVPLEKPEKMVNVSNEIEVILGGMFPGYYTDEAARKKALDYYATPEGSKFVQAAAARYAKSKTPDQYVPVQTTDGIATFKTKGDGSGRLGASTGATKPLPEGAAKEFGALSALRTSIGEIGKLYRDDYVGPVAGRYYSVAENIVNLPPDQVRFYAYTNDAKDALLRARSGAQINEQEYARLVKFLPTPELPPENFKARAKRFEEQVNIIISEKAKTYRSQGYSVDDGTARPAEAQAPASPGAVPPRSGPVPSSSQTAPMTSLPPAGQHKGRIIRRSDGFRMKSDGTKWILMR